jgi:hypothetical protein
MTTKLFLIFAVFVSAIFSRNDLPKISDLEIYELEDYELHNRNAILIEKSKITYEDVKVTVGLYTYDYEYDSSSNPHWKNGLYMDSGIFVLITRSGVDTTLKYFEIGPEYSRWDIPTPLVKMKKLNSVKIDGYSAIVSYIYFNDKEWSWKFDLFNYLHSLESN